MRAVVRQPRTRLPAIVNTSWIAAGDLAEQKNYSMLDGVHVVVHLAGRAHILKDVAADPLAEFRRANVYATARLAKAAADYGVRRFIFISSIGVNGNTSYHQAFVESSPPAPHNPYATSKWEGEQALYRVAQDTGLEVVVLRPPLVYGPGAKGNFHRLMQLVRRGWPLPLGAIRNRRSLLYLGNLVNAIRLCVEHPAAAGQTFLLDDGEAVSTPQLIRSLAFAMGRRARLVAVPVSALRLAGALFGQHTAVAQLTDSLVIDSSAIRARLGWVPPYSMRDGLAFSVPDLK